MEETLIPKPPEIPETPEIPTISWKYLLSGLITTFLSRVPALPLERVIIIQQAHASTKFATNKKKKIRPYQILKALYKKEGIRGILKGNGINAYKLGTYLSLELYLFEILKQKFARNRLKTYNQYIQELIAGSLAGTASFYCVYPLEFARVMVSLNKTPKNAPPYKLMKYLYKRHGFFNMYKGAIITCSQFIPYSGFKFAFFGLFQRYTKYFLDKEKLNSFENFMCGGMGGVVALLLMYPMDVIGIQRVVQLLSDDKRKFSYVKLCRSIYREHGVRGFYSGTRANVYKCFIICAVAMMVNDHFKEYLMMNKK